MKVKLFGIVEKISIILPVLTIFASLFAVAQLGYQAATDKSISIGSRVDSLNAEIKYQKAVDDVQEIRAEVEKLKSVFSQIPVEKLGEPSVVELAALKERIRSVEEKVSGLGAAIDASPEKALAIPILRKDFDYLVKDGENQRSIFRAEIDKIYEQQKWITNGIITVLLLVIASGAALLIRIWLRGSKIAGD